MSTTPQAAGVRLFRSRLLLLASCAWLVSFRADVCQAQADDYATLIDDALVEFGAGNFAEARVLFEQAHTLRPSARTWRGLGLASFELREYIRAERELNASLVDLRQPLSAEQREQALSLLLRLERYIGTLIIHTRPESALITLDGASVPHQLKVDLGAHELAVQAPGFRTLTRAVSVEGGKTQTLELRLIALKEGPSSFGANPNGVGPSPSFGASRAAASRAAPAPGSLTRSAPAADSGSMLESWWFWTAIGLVAVGGVVSAIALSSQQRSMPAPVAPGVQVQVLSWSRAR